MKKVSVIVSLLGTVLSFSAFAQEFATLQSTKTNNTVVGVTGCKNSFASESSIESDSTLNQNTGDEDGLNTIRQLVRPSSLSTSATAFFTGNSNKKVFVIVKSTHFYRVRLERFADGVLLQDFYDTGEKRTNPYLSNDLKKAIEDNFLDSYYNYLSISGPFVLFYKNGQVAVKGFYDNGKAKGLWVYWFENGQKKASGRFKNGLKDGQWVVWRETGQREQKGLYLNGLKEGVWISWYKNGLKKEAGRYSAGEKVEKWNYWDDAGRMIKKEYVAN